MNYQLASVWNEESEEGMMGLDRIALDFAPSAAPDHLQEGAGYWALEEGGYVLGRETQNGFTCIINRDHPLNRKPTCYGAEGTRTILPKVVFVGNLLMQGTPVADVRAQVREGFASGRFMGAEKPGSHTCSRTRSATTTPARDRWGRSRAT